MQSTSEQQETPDVAAQGATITSEPSDGLGLDFSDCPVLLAGYSHIYALIGYDRPEGGFAASKGFRVDPVRDISGLFMCHSAWPRTEGYWKDVRRAAEEGNRAALVISFRGNDHLARFLIRPKVTIDFLSRQFPDLPIDTDAQLVPESLVEALFRTDYDAFRPVLRRLVAGGMRVILVETPPPKADDVFLREMVGNESYFVQVCNNLKISIDDIEFSPWQLRLKLWGLLQSMTAQIATAEGAEFLSVPTSALDENGTLRRDYWSRDCSHANWEYGKLALADLHRHLKGLEL